MGDTPRIVTTAAELAPAIGRVIHAAATDKARPNLAGVHFSPRPKALRLAAADNYRIAWADIPTDNGTPSDGPSAVYVNGAPEPFTLALADVKLVYAAAKAAAKAKYPPITPVTVDVDGLSVSVAVGAQTFALRAIDGRYPNIEAVIPPADRPGFAIAVNARYLADLVATADDSGTIILRFGDALAPFRVEPANGYVADRWGSVVMPARHLRAMEARHD